ncbi:hypothetical protein ACNVED_10735 [Legionella sp. D16C41]|uniref:hypothetical protein n=1 Tax=Legionella sp. D16C41 TaxID=3402688 RepID=UPI003AF44E9F
MKKLFESVDSSTNTPASLTSDNTSTQPGKTPDPKPSNTLDTQLSETLCTQVNEAPPVIQTEKAAFKNKNINFNTASIEAAKEESNNDNEQPLIPFYEQDLKLCQYSVFVLNDQGNVVGACTPQSERQSFLSQKRAIKDNVSNDGSTHGYLVFNGHYGTPSNQQPLQIIITWPLSAGAITMHNDNFRWITRMQDKFPVIPLLKSKGITLDPDYSYSGECHTSLTGSQVKNLLGEPLKDITLNLRATRTDIYRKGDIPLISYFPETLLSTHESHKEHDKNINFVWANDQKRKNVESADKPSQGQLTAVSQYTSPITSTSPTTQTTTSSSELNYAANRLFAVTQEVDNTRESLTPTTTLTFNNT